MINDPLHPENNNSVRIFKFGKKIMDKILDKSRPTFADEKPVNVFDYWEGADFKLRMKQVESYPNYDTSVFNEPSPIGDDSEILEIAKKQHKLSELIAPHNFKSYDELKAKLASVLGEATSQHDDEFETVAPAAPKVQFKEREAPKVQTKAAVSDVPFDTIDEDSAEYFRSLAA